MTSSPDVDPPGKYVCMILFQTDTKMRLPCKCIFLDDKTFQEECVSSLLSRISCFGVLIDESFSSVQLFEQRMLSTMLFCGGGGHVLSLTCHVRLMSHRCLQGQPQCACKEF